MESKTTTIRTKVLSFVCFLMTCNLAFAQTNVTVGGNTLTSTSTIINRSWSSNASLNANYSCAEILYTKAEINVAGGAISIDRVAFNKTGGSTSGSGTFNTPNVSIYMKTVSTTTIATGTYDLGTYTLVWSGTFPSSGAFGFKEVILSTVYSYANGANDNLSILVLNNSGSIPANNNTDRPGWGCNTLTPDTRSRFNNSSTALPTFGGSSTTRPQVRLRYTGCSAPTNPSFSAGATTLCPGGTSTYTASATGGTTVSYSIFSGGASINSNSGGVTSVTAGFTVRATISNACGASTVDRVVTVPPAAVAPSAITGTAQICSGTTTTLTATGGDATTKWFTGSCGGTQVGTGASFTTPSLASNTTYFAANDGCGGISSCATVTVLVTLAAVAPTGITGTNSICSSTTTTLTATGGDATTKWFTGSCGGTQVGTGASFTTPSLATNTTYFAANDGCGGISSCATITVTVTSTASAPTGITGTIQICSGTTTTLAATGGDATTKWFTGSCGATQVGTGASFTTPSLATNITYFAANEGCNGITTCATVDVNIENVPNAPLVIIGDVSICENAIYSYSVTNIVGESYNWTLPNGWIGTSTSSQINATANNASGTISVTAENNCGESTASTLVVTVNTLPIVALDPFGTVCSSDAAFTLIGGSPAGGTYAIDGTETVTFNPATQGLGDFTITYQYTDAQNCSATATENIQVDICTGIDAVNKNNVKIYPNPAEDVLFIDFAENGVYIVTLFNSTGKKIENYRFTHHDSNSNSLNVQQLSSGLYYLIVQAENAGTTNFKLIVE